MSSDAVIDRFRAGFRVTALLLVVFVLLPVVSAMLLGPPLAVLADLLFGLSSDAIAHGRSWVLDTLTRLVKFVFIGAPIVVLWRSFGTLGNTVAAADEMRRAILRQAKLGTALLLAFLACTVLYFGRWRGFPEFGSFNLVQLQANYWAPLLMLGLMTLCALLRVWLRVLKGGSLFAGDLLTGLNLVLVIAVPVYLSKMRGGSGWAALW